MEIKTYLPIFNGFYRTWFECSNDLIENEIDRHRTETGSNDLAYDVINFDFKDYNKRVAEACVSEIWNELKLHFDLDIKEFDIVFERIVSPKYYNYTNDSIDVTFKLNKTIFSKILNYLDDQKEEFKEYIEENYSSRGGFVSSYSNDSKDWIISLTNYLAHYIEDNNTDAGDFGLNHLFGAVVEFVLLNEGYTNEDLQSAVSDETCYISSFVNS